MSSHSSYQLMLPPAGHHQPRTPSLPSATSYFPVTFLTNSHSSLLLASMDLYLPLPGCSSLILPSYIPHTNCCSLTLSLWPAPISTNTPASPLSLWPPPISPLNQPLLPQLPLSSSCPPPPPHTQWAKWFAYTERLWIFTRPGP